MIDVRNENVFYLETSSINYLVDNFNLNSIKKVIDKKNIKFYISTVTISEILMTKKNDRKELLIDCIKEVCDVDLLMSPTELILKYIYHGMPELENFFDLTSNESFSKVWDDVKRFDQKTFVYNFVELNEKIKMLQSLFKEQVDNIEQDIFSNIYYLNDYISIYENLTELSKELLLQRKIAWVILFLLLSADINLFDRSLIDDFWNSKGINSNNVIDSMKYIITNLGRLTFVGPISVMANMFIVQHKVGVNRGTLYDMLHSIYLIYTNYFLTYDKHFIALKNSNTNINFLKINDISDVIIQHNE